MLSIRFMFLFCLYWIPSTIIAETWITVRQETKPQWLTLPVTIEATSSATVSAQTSGRITELPYDVNDMVLQGAVIVRFTDIEQQARFKQAQAQANETQTRLDEMQKEQQRITELHEQGLVAKSALDQANANFAAAKARHQQAQAALMAAAEQLEQTVVRAPYTGIVQQRFVELGELANPGQPLIRGLSLEHLRISGQLSQQHVAAAQQVTMAQLVAQDGTVLPLNNIQLKIAPEADRLGHSFLFRLNLPQGDYREHGLYPGSWHRLKLNIAEHTMLVIPKLALIKRGEMVAVWLASPSGRILQPVRVKELSDSTLQVLSGLAAGDRIIANASLPATGQLPSAKVE